jgi:hypothetical protein
MLKRNEVRAEKLKYTGKNFVNILVYITVESVVKVIEFLFI